MSAITNLSVGSSTAGSLKPVDQSRLVATISDALVLTKRQLIHMWRIPVELAGATFFSVMFVVLFRYVFAGAINVGNGMSYVNFLMAGIFVQSLTFSATNTGVSLSQDIKKGLIDRFRSLPMAPSAVLAGQTLSDTVKNAFAVTVMIAIGLVVGFRPSANAGEWLAAIGIMLLFTFAMSWIGASIALLVNSPESVEPILMSALFPLTFASSAFVPVETMPGWLQAFTKHQPVSVVVDAVRSLLLGQPVGDAGWQAVVWCIGLLVIFMPIATRLYKRATSR